MEQDAASIFKYKARLEAMSEVAKLGASMVATQAALTKGAHKRNLVCLEKVLG